MHGVQLIKFSRCSKKIDSNRFHENSLDATFFLSIPDPWWIVSSQERIPRLGEVNKPRQVLWETKYVRDTGEFSVTLAVLILSGKASGIQKITQTINSILKQQLPTKETQGRMVTISGYSDFWLTSISYDWSMVFKTIINQSQVTLVHSNDLTNRRAYALYPFPL